MKFYVEDITVFEEESSQVKGAYTFDELYGIVKKDPKLKKLAELLEKSKNIEQNPEHHSEPSVFDHIKSVTDRLANSRYTRVEQELNAHVDLPVSGFFHDIGKAVEGVTYLHPKKKDKTFNNRRYYTAPGHEKESAKIIDEFYEWIESLGADPENVKDIVLNHMRVGDYVEGKIKKRRKRMEMASKKNIRSLLKFHKQDQGGENPTPMSKFYKHS